jgi:hypothetical protein
MLLRAQALETMQKELKQAQQAVLDRERELLSAATKDGVTAATATAVILAGNPGYLGTVSEYKCSSYHS